MIVRYLDRFGYGDVGGVKRYRFKENILWDGNLLDNGVLNGLTHLEEKIYVFNDGEEYDYENGKKYPFSIVECYCDDYAVCIITNRNVFIMNDSGETINTLCVALGK